MEPNPREMELVRRAAAGDEVALTALLVDARRRLTPYVASRIPASLRGLIDADDLMQNALVEVYRKITTFEDRGADSFFRWVATIAIRKLRDALRDQRTARRGGGRAAAASPAGAAAIETSMIALLDLFSAPGHTPSQSVARVEAVSAVRQALDALPEDHRRAIWLVNIEGRSVAAAAAEMGRSERAVHNLCHKGRQRLRELLGDQSRFLSRRD